MQQRLISRLRRALPGALVVLLLAISSAASLEAQVRFVPDSLPSAISQWLDKGRTLEREQRWGEALTLYEDALREHPHEQTLSERHDLAKIHYDLSRRYADRSYQSALSTLSTQSALELYGEVLLKINSHHVQAPDWKVLLERGAQSLSVALHDEQFHQSHLAGVRAETIDAFDRSMRQQVTQWAINTRQDAQRGVAAVCRMAQSSLGIAPTPIAFEFLCGAASGLDNYSTYLTGDQLRDLYAQIDGNFVGLGIELKAEDGALLLVNVIAGSPALRAGLRPGDRIVAVDGQSTTQLNTDQAATLLQGDEGTYVEVTVDRGEQQRINVKVRREHVEVPSVEGTRIVDAEYAIGYFKLASFQKTTTRDVDAALWELHRQGMRSLIIDLRGNPGGLLTTSVEVADKFLQGGMIVSTRGRSAQEDFNYRAHRAGTWSVPLVVLIDGDSASASEIFAGAIRDNGRGTVVGVRSYGKGSVQGIFPLSAAGAGIRLTTAKFYSPGGRPISKVGVQPDIVVRHAAKATSQASFSAATKEDAVLQAGMQAARAQVAQR